MAAKSAPESIETLVARFEPSVFDAPRGRARVRLNVTGEGSWDALVERDRVRLRPANGHEPDAELTAPASSWRRMSSDLVGGMEEYSARRLQIRRNLHIGVGFLAATGPDGGPGRLRF